MIFGLKKFFSRHGIPQEVRSDNGPQYSSKEFADFTSSYNFSHTTSSPYHPKGNGLAERTVQTVKRMLSKSRDPFMALLSYRSTPLSWCHLSPAELLMGRRLRSNLPQVTTQLIADWKYLPEARRADAKFKQRQKEDYDRHHKVCPLPPIADDSPVWFDTKRKREAGKIVSRDRHERSYWVETDDGGMVRRNRCQLYPAPTLTSSNSSTKALKSDNAQSSCERSDYSRILTRSQTATKIRPPNRYSPSKT